MGSMKEEQEDFALANPLEGIELDQWNRTSFHAF
jgi:hypothetical protein